MDLAAVFYVSVYGLVCLAGSILAWAEGQVSVTILLPPLAIAALIFNERLRLVRLSTSVINACGLISLLYPALEAMSESLESRLLAGAHVLVLLQITLLFLQKTAYQYWWMCALSCLQIAVSAVLTSSAAFGMWILLYIFWATWTLSIYTLLLSRVRHSSVPQGPVTWVWPKISDSDIVHKQAAVLGEFRPGTFESPEGTGVSLRFLLGILGITSWAVGMGLIVFILTPRVWLGGINTFQDVPDLSSRMLTGFSDKVQLGDLGRVLENPAPVLELRMFDNDTNKPLRIDQIVNALGYEEPLLRGAALSEYKNGEWFKDTGHVLTHYPPGNIPRQSNLWRQEIRREPIGTRTLFGLTSTMYGRLEDHQGQIRRMVAIDCLEHTGALFGDSVEYTLFSYSLLAPPPPRVNQTPQPLLPGAREKYLALPDNVPQLQELARQQVALVEQRRGVLHGAEEQIARELERWLRDSGEFTYTLDQSIQDPKLDPVEDFLVNRKAGHCQYYATALALLLRASGIPSRVVTGFKGAVTGSDPYLLNVQQRHAHAWVEAYLEDELRWLTLDATPAAREDSVEEIGRRGNWWSQTSSTVSGLWQDYVVNLSYSRQQRDLYGPLKDFGMFLVAVFMSLMAALRDLPGFAEGLQAEIAILWQQPQRIIQSRNLPILVMLLMMFAGVFWGTRKLWRDRLRRRRQAWEVRTGRRVDWYDEFLALLQRWQIKPLPYQTQQEFAAQLRRELPVQKWPSELRDFPERITAAFYRLRFGNEEQLSDTEMQDLKLGLRTLSQLTAEERQRPAGTMKS